ncbi:MAG: DHA2 family efflux MFS transporter permease subunit [Proteobacteria bacterium]|nr:DHA2 family efflux MFS transporter permease subunit [Pseudomonadota bacterium]
MNPPRVSKWLVTLSVMIPTLIEILDTTVVNVSLTHIQGSLSAGQEEVTWVLTSYLVSNAVVIPMSGWLAALMGRKRYLIASIVMFTASSLLCGLAVTLPQLVFFRVLQGIGGGGLQPMSMAILMEAYPPEERGMAMAIFGMGIVLGPILGPVMGGYLTDAYSWHWIFYINLPIGLLAIYMCHGFIFDPPEMHRLGRGARIDYAGIALLCLGLGALQIVLDKGQLEDWFASEFILVLTVFSAVCLISFVFWELKHEKPILDLRIFKDRSFATGNLVMFTGFFAFFGSIVLLPIFVQKLMGYSALQAGLVLGPSGMLTMAVMPLVGKLTQRVDARKLLAVGMLVNAAALYHMSGFNLYIDFYTAALSRVIQGVGMPFFFVSLSMVTMAWVRIDQMNNASAIFNLLRNLGGSFGVAFVTTLLARRTQFHQHRLVEHLTPFNFGFNFRMEELKAGLAAKLGTLADHTHAASGMIYGQLQRQAAAMAFNDTFHAQMLMFLGMLALLFIIRRPPVGRRQAPGAH